MYEFGQGKTLLKTSEVRPEGFSYYNQVFNSYGADQDQGLGQTYHQADGEHEGYQEAEDDHSGHQPHPADYGGQHSELSGPGSHYDHPGHVDTSHTDQFRADPDVSQFYHFQSEKNEQEGPQVPYIPSYARAAETDGDHHSVQGENYSHYPPSQTDRRAPPPVYEELNHSKQRFENRFTQSVDDIGYPDVQFYDDFDDYGIEMEFENELRRLTEAVEDESGQARSGGQGRGSGGDPGSDLRPRVYLGGSRDYGEDMDFHYPSDFDY